MSFKLLVVFVFRETEVAIIVQADFGGRMSGWEGPAHSLDRSLTAHEWRAKVSKRSPH